ncbi:MAG: hypothetical protein RR364_00530 [Lachnospiraceae bacterium]
MKKRSRMLTLFALLAVLLVVSVIVVWYRDRGNATVVRGFLDTYYTIEDSSRYKNLIENIELSIDENQWEEGAEIPVKAYEQYTDIYKKYFTEDGLKRFVASREITGLERIAHDERSTVAVKSIDTVKRKSEGKSKVFYYKIVVTYTISDDVGTRVFSDEWRIDTKIMNGKELISRFRMV